MEVDINPDKTFTVYWRTGNRDVIRGRNQAQAMSLAGFGAGSIAAVDFICEGDNQEYEWKPQAREWQRHAAASSPD